MKHPGRWVGAAVIMLAMALLFQSLLTNTNFRWDIVGTYLFDVLVLRGIGWTWS